MALTASQQKRIFALPHIGWLLDLRRWLQGQSRIASVLIYGCVNFLPRLTTAFFAVGFASAFTLVEYGQFGVLSVIIGLLGIVMDLGVPQAILRDFYDLHQNKKAVEEYLQSMVGGAAIICAIMTVPIGFALYAFSDLLHIDPTRRLELTCLVLIIAFLERAISIFSSVFVAMQRAAQYASGSISQALVTVAASVVFVFVLHLGVPGALMSLLAGRVANLIICQLLFWRYASRRVGLKVDWHAVWRGLKFGLPFVPNRASVWARDSGLRPALINVVSLAEIGVYSLASAFAALPLNATSAVDQALGPIYYKRRVQGAPHFLEKLRHFRVWYLILLLPLWAAAILFCPDAIRLVGGVRYSGAAPICSALLCATFIRVQQPNHIRQVNYLRKTWINPLLTIPCAALAVALAVLLARTYGISYVGWAPVIAELLLYLGYAVAIRPMEPVQEPVGLVLGLSGGLAVLAILADSIHAQPGFSAITAKVLVIVAIGTASFYVWLWPNRASMLSLVSR